METRAMKRKRELELWPTAFGATIVESPTTLLISVRAPELESGEGSCDSVTSDAGAAKAGEDDVLHIAHALTKVCAKSPEAVIEFVWRVSLATVRRSINWGVIRDDDSTKLLGGDCSLQHHHQLLQASGIRQLGEENV